MIQVYQPKAVVETKAIKIDEYFGCVAGSGSELSACVVTVAEAAQEAYQTPGFDEYVIVLDGTVELHWAEGMTIVKAGEGAFLPKLTRVKWVWPGPCRYIPICLPAFTPSNCFREDEEGGKDLAKSSKAMDYLRQLHARAAHPFLLHVAPKDLWQKAKTINQLYFPPTYKQDGSFTHATADPDKLIAVLNHFYKSSTSDYVCLKMTFNSLEQHGVNTLFEHTSPVGDTPAIDMGDQLFPHIQGGIPPESVLEVLPVLRAQDGTFLSVPSLTTSSPVSPSKEGDATKKFLQSFLLPFASGIIVGAALFSSAFARSQR